jgi:hypothetical protein
MARMCFLKAMAATVVEPESEIGDRGGRMGEEHTI